MQLPAKSSQEWSSTKRPHGVLGSTCAARTGARAAKTKSPEAARRRVRGGTAPKIRRPDGFSTEKSGAWEGNKNLSFMRFLFSCWQHASTCSAPAKEPAMVAGNQPARPGLFFQAL